MAVGIPKYGIGSKYYIKPVAPANVPVCKVYGPAFKYISTSAVPVIRNTQFQAKNNASLRDGRLKEPLAVLDAVEHRGTAIDHGRYASVLQACANTQALEEGKQVHAHILVSGGIEQNVFMGTRLVNMYAKCGSLGDARQVFDKLPTPNMFSWTAMIGGYARHGCCEEALTLYKQMQRAGMCADNFIIPCVLRACAGLIDPKQGKDIQSYIIRSGFESDVFIASGLVDMYAKRGDVESARQVFDKMSQRDVISWNAMIAGYAQNDHGDKALKLFDEMQLVGVMPNVATWNAMIAGYAQNGYHDKALNLFRQMRQEGVKPNTVTITSILTACAGLSSLQQGKEIHDCVIKSGFESDIFVGNTLIDVYAKFGSMQNARQVFDKMSQRDVISWTVMITCCVQNGNGDEALSLLHEMEVEGVKPNVISWTAVIDGYVQNGQRDEAMKVFGLMQLVGIKPDVVTWNTIIAGHAQGGNCDEALRLFSQMQLAGVKPDLVTWNAMIAGYAQTGYCHEALNLIDQMQLAGIKSDVITWNGAIAAYAQNKHGNEALKFFRQMQLAGVKPNSVTIASVLPACALLAALEQGKDIHGYVTRIGFESEVFVGNALIDMYFKCGCLKNAHQVFVNLSRRDVVSWNAMISGYALHGHGEDALTFFNQMEQEGMDPDRITFIGVLSACSHAGLVDQGWKYFNSMSQEYHIIPSMEHYACMVDLLGRAGRLDEAHAFVNKMPFRPNATVWGALLGACRIHHNIELGEHIAKPLFQLEPENAGNYVLMSNIYARAGRWADVAREPQMEKICTTLKNLSGLMKAAGYVPDTHFVLHDVEQEEKEHVLCGHSERLAVAFGLNNTCPGIPIRIIKNLHACGDCHTATKMISKIAEQKTIVRDSSRFHHFKDGLCSCHDYW